MAKKVNPKRSNIFDRGRKAAPKRGRNRFLTVKAARAAGAY